MGRMIVYLTFLQFFMIHAAFGKTPFKACKSASSKVTDVTIPGCDAPPCMLKKGTNAQLAITFTAGQAYTGVKADVHGIISTIPIPVPFTPPNVDGCHNCNLQCPIQKGQSYTYKNVIPVKSSYPNFKLVVRWELVDENNNDIVCIEVPCQIES